MASSSVGNPALSIGSHTHQLVSRIHPYQGIVALTDAKYLPLTAREKEIISYNKLMRRNSNFMVFNLLP